VPVSDTLLDKIAAATEQFSGDDIRSLFRDARAGELVGKVPAGAWRLGQLVGELRRGRQERDVRRNSAAPVVTAGGRRARLSEQSMGAVVIRRALRSDAAVPPGGTQPADSPAGGAGEGERQP
jgi:transitional endoplasmic reticulum ATPase